MKAVKKGQIDEAHARREPRVETPIVGVDKGKALPREQALGHPKIYMVAVIAPDAAKIDSDAASEKGEANDKNVAIFR